MLLLVWCFVLQLFVAGGVGFVVVVGSVVVEIVVDVVDLCVGVVMLLFMVLLLR